MEKENFILSKLRMQKNGGVKIRYEIVEHDGDIAYTEKFNIESSKLVHPDMLELLSSLRYIVGKMFHVKDESDAEQFIDVTGVSFSGTSDNVGVIIYARITSDNGAQINVSTPRIILTGNVLGFEDRLNDICRRIHTESYKFIFEGNIAPLEVME